MLPELPGSWVPGVESTQQDPGPSRSELHAMEHSDSTQWLYSSMTWVEILVLPLPSYLFIQTLPFYNSTYLMGLDENIHKAPTGTTYLVHSSAQ